MPETALLGAVEGATEYLPVSSTGHLLVAQELLGLGSTEQSRQAADAYAVVIQIGAIAAVGGIYRGRLTSIVRGVRGHDTHGRRLLGAVLIAFAPAALVGLLAGGLVQERLFGPWPIIGAWITGGVVLLIPRLTRAHGSVSLEQMTCHSAGVIGAAQVLALWPGTSRSLVTIVAALAVGLTLKAAVEFSFILGVITLSAATGYELTRNGTNIVETFGVTTTMVGIAVAFATAWISATWMVDYLHNRSLASFGWYRIGVAALVLGLMGSTDLI